MASFATTKPVNLTEVAGPRPWSEVAQNLRIHARCGGAMLQIQALDHAEHGHRNDSHAHTVYVIVSGYGLLRCRDTGLECTEGDVLFVPADCPHRFERMDGDLRVWRISLAPEASPEGT